MEIVVFLESDVTTPVADLDVTVKLLNVGDRLLELEANTRGGDSTSGLLIERSIYELGALLDRELLDIAASRELCVIGNVGSSSLNLGLLLLRGVGGRYVDGEVVSEELLGPLRNGRRKRSVSLEIVVGDAEGLLSTGLERRGQLNTIVLNITNVKLAFCCLGRKPEEHTC